MEQYMMYEKARLFGDEVIMKQILETRDPRAHKRLGRLVSGFKQDVWEANRLKIVYQGNHAKFSQNADLLRKLKYPDAKRRSRWKGQNLLGEVLTLLRCELTHETYPHLRLRRSNVQ
jgi:predicted NAD-dependent protein-ADP-ribosyltransferase YbiA (DUF1768 family)